MWSGQDLIGPGRQLPAVVAWEHRCAVHCSILPGPKLASGPWLMATWKPWGEGLAVCFLSCKEQATSLSLRKSLVLTLGPESSLYFFVVLGIEFGFYLLSHSLSSFLL
jgi:hypothetical protein